MSDELSVDVHDRGPDVVVSVAGELDFGTAPRLLASTQPLAAAGRSVVLDLGDLMFCDSSGLGALVRLHKAAEDAGGTLVLARVRPRIQSTMELTMLHRLLHIRADIPGPEEQTA